jgi:hypothetical protein
MTMNSPRMKKIQNPKKVSKTVWTKAGTCGDTSILIDPSFVTITALRNIISSRSITAINVYTNMQSLDPRILLPALGERMVMPMATMATTVTVLLRTLMVNPHPHLRPGLCMGLK